MHKLTCRRATIDDVPAIAELRERSGWAGGAGAETMRRYLAGVHHPQHARAPRAMFVAEGAGELAGFVAGHLTTRFGCDGELQWLLVAPAERGGAAGGALLGELAAWFAGEGAARVCVNVAPENTRARAASTRGTVPSSWRNTGWSGPTSARRGRPPAVRPSNGSCG